MPNVYLLLSRTDTLFARAMHGLTGNRYTHVSLALDRDLEQMYSFARRYEIAPLPAGFIRENLYDGVYGRSGTADSLVLELPVSQKAYDRIARRLEKMERRQLDYGYDVLGLALAWLGIATSGATSSCAASLWPRHCRRRVRWSCRIIPVWCARRILPIWSRFGWCIRARWPGRAVWAAVQWPHE